MPISAISLAKYTASPGLHSDCHLFSPILMVIVGGVVSGIFITYSNSDTSLSCMSSFTAIALIVVLTAFPSVPKILIAPLYRIPFVALGVLPSLV